MTGVALQRRPFPARLEHRPDEPSYGLLLRTYQANGGRKYDTMFRRFGAEGGHTVAKVDPLVVAELCKADVASVTHATPELSPGVAIMLGETLRRNHFSCRTRRWCPHCMAEDPYHRVWWDVMPVAACPFHGVALETRCACKYSLRWQNFALGHCLHGHKFADVPARTIAPDDLLSDTYIVDRLLGRDRAPMPLVDGLALGEVIDALEVLGKSWVDDARPLTQVRQEFGTPALANRGFRLLQDFPHGIDALLYRLMDSQDARQGRWGIAKSYGQAFLEWVNSLPDNALGKAMRQAMENHARANVVIKTGQKIGGKVIAEEGYSLLEASTLCGVSHERFRRLGVGMGFIPEQKTQGKPIRLDKDLVDGLAVRMKGHKDLETVAAELGVNPVACAKLAHEGLVDVIQLGGGNRKGLNKWILPEGSARGLLSRLDAIAPKVSGEGDIAWAGVCGPYSRSSIAHVLTLALEDRIEVIGIDETGVGLQRYLFDKRAAKNAVRKSRFPDNNLMEAAKKLGQPHDVVISLVHNSVLATHPVGNMNLITDAELERFRQAYITRAECKEVMGGKWQQLLKKAGVKPECPRPRFKKEFYLREQVMAVVGRG